MTGINIGARAFAPTPPVTDVLYGGKGQSQTTSDLYTIDTTTGAGTSIGAIGFGITGLAFRPSDDVLFGVTNNNSASNPRSLITIDTSTGAGTLVGALGVTNGIADISFRSDGVLFGWGSTTHRLYTINTTTGAATQVSATTFGTLGGGMSFDPTDVLSSFSNGTDGVWYIVDPSTGSGTSQGSLSGYGTADAISAAACDVSDVMWAIVVDSSSQSSLATIDRATDTVTQVAVTESFLDGIAWGPA